MEWDMPFYSVSDPRAQVFKGFVEKLALEKQRDNDFGLYTTVAKLAPEVIAKERRIYKGSVPMSISIAV